MVSPSWYKLAASREQEAGEWVNRLCRAVRESVDARRVTAWLYDAPAQTVSPLATDEPDSAAVGELLERWQETPLERFPAACTALLESRSVEIRDAQNDVRLPSELAADLALDSIRFEPLIAGSPVGMLSIEPGSAAGAQVYSLLPIVAAAVARVSSGRDSGRRHEETAFLLDLTDEVMTAGSLDDLLAALCERTATFLGARGASVFLLEAGRLQPAMTRVAQGVRPSEEWRAFMGSTEPLPAAQAAVQSGRPVIASEASSPLIGDHWARSLGQQAALAVPLGKTSSGVIGALVLDHDQPNRFTPDDARPVLEAAVRIAPTIDQARAREQSTVHVRAAGAVRRLLQEGSGAVSVSEAAEVVARIARETLGAEYATVLLKHDGDRVEHVVTVGDDGTFARAFTEQLTSRPISELKLWDATERQRRPVFVENARASMLLPAELAGQLGLQSYAAVPLLAEGRAIGVVILSNASRSHRWDDEARRLVSQLALEGSLVIENAGLRAVEHEHLDQLAEQAFHDPLTGLPNRSLFSNRLEHAFARMNRRRGTIAVLFLDLDGFKPINDSHGHEAGDRLLLAVSRRMQACLRPEDTIARLGGDEFTVLIEDIEDARFVTRVAERIAESLKAPFLLNGRETSITASIGIAVTTGLETSPDELLRHSDLAMYEAKRAGKARHVVYGGPTPGPESMAGGSYSAGAPARQYEESEHAEEVLGAEPGLEPPPAQVGPEGVAAAEDIEGLDPREGADPGDTRLEVGEPGTSSTLVGEAEEIHSEGVAPEEIAPEFGDSEGDDIEVDEPEVDEPEVAEPEVAEPEVAEPEVAEPEVAEPEVAEPEVAEPEATLVEPDDADIEQDDPDPDAQPNGLQPSLTEARRRRRLRFPPRRN